MTAIILLCVLSTLSFCFSLRGLVAVMANAKKTQLAWSQHRQVFSGAAWRLARAYVGFALFVIALVSLISAFRSYLELFRNS